MQIAVPEQRTELAEVLAGAQPRQPLLATVGEYPDDVDLAFFDRVHEPGSVALLEDRLPGDVPHALRCGI